MKRALSPLLLLLVLHGYSQELAFSRKIVDTLTSPTFWGRGYTNDGMKKAGDFLEVQFKSYGLTPLKGNDFKQKFSYPVNTFPGDMQVSVNGRDLIPGKEFIVAAESRGIKAKGNLERADSVQFVNRQNRVIIKLEDKLTMEVSPEAADLTVIQVDKKALTDAPGSFKANIENKLIKDFDAANICAMVKGTSKPDSFIFITAHYDHLGGLGKDTYFPGANDNASGVSLLLNLAHYYAKNPQPYSIGFILFAGEEAGLLGSKYFTDHPLIPLSKIRFLLNTDLAGTGDEGITVMPASTFSTEFGYMKTINEQDKLLVKINERNDNRPNSDHYFFIEKKVPAFFFYTLGGIKAYHDVFDKGETLPLTETVDLFKLIVKFNDKLMGK